eukprot:1244302-Lingulodinium_polyedra.AAC.1
MRTNNVKYQSYALAPRAGALRVLALGARGRRDRTPSTTRAVEPHAHAHARARARPRPNAIARA